MAERDFSGLKPHDFLDDPDSTYRHPRRSRSMPLDFVAAPQTPKQGKLVKKPSSARAREQGSEARSKRKGPPSLLKEAFRHPDILLSAQPNVTRALRYAYDSPDSNVNKEEGERQAPPRGGTLASTSVNDVTVLVREVQSIAISVSNSSAVTQGMHPIKRDLATIPQRSASFSQPTRHAYPHLHQASRERATTMTSQARPSTTPVLDTQGSVIHPSDPPPSHAQAPIASPYPGRSRQARHYSPSRTPTQRSPARTPPPLPGTPLNTFHPFPAASLPSRPSSSTLRASTSPCRVPKHRERSHNYKDREKNLYVAGVCLSDFPEPPTHLPEPMAASDRRVYPDMMYGRAVHRSLPVGARPSAFMQKKNDYAP